MTHASIECIFIRPECSGPVREVERVEAEAGFGLVGDHGHWLAKKAGKNAPDRQVTLIAIEAIEAANAEAIEAANAEGSGAADAEATGAISGNVFQIAPEETRRNLLTRGIDLNALVGREFTVGAVRLRGIELCEPCTHLQRLTRKPVLQHLAGRGGLRAEILRGGVIFVGSSLAAK